MSPIRSWLLLLLIALAACRVPEPVAPPTPATLTPQARLEPTARPTDVPTPAAPARPTPTPAVPNKWGVHLLLDDGVSQWPVEVWDEHLAYARRLVGRGGYALELIRQDDLDPAKWQRFLDGAARYELTPIIRLATQQDRLRGHWVAPQPDDGARSYRRLGRRFARFLEQLRYRGPLYVVVGNEPNRGDEWGGRPDPAEYARFLIDVSAELRAALPGRVAVLNGALDQYAPHTREHDLNGFRAYDAASFMDGMQAAEPRVWDAIDIWASHAYPLGPFAEHPGRRDFRIDDLADEARRRGAPWPGLFNRGVNSYRWELYKLRTYGVTRPLRVFVTETGWRHRESQASGSDRAGAEINAGQAARFIRLAFEGDALLAPHEHSWTPWAADADVGAVVLFALGGEPSRWGHTNLLDLGPNGRVLGLKPPFAELLK